MHGETIKMRETKFHTHIKQRAVRVLYILILNFLHCKWEDSIFWAERWQAFPEFNVLFLHTCNFVFLVSLQDVSNFPSFQVIYHRSLCCGTILCSAHQI
jgi:hypothetical protein